MIVYYNLQNDEIYAIAENDVIVPISAAIEKVEYEGEVPRDIQLALFNGIKFYSKPDNICALIKQEQINAEAKRVLEQTDWYVIRQIETGKQLPNEIKEARYHARQLILSAEEVMRKSEKPNDPPALSNGMRDHGMKRA